MARAGDFTVGAQLLDEHGWWITGSDTSATFSDGQHPLTVDIPGFGIGDAGASGPATVRLTIRPKDADESCAAVLVHGAAAGTLDASTFDGWVTTLARLQARLSDDIASGEVSADAATSLPQALQAPSPDAPDLPAFRGLLAGAQVVSDPERARLDSLVGRLIDQARRS